MQICPLRQPQASVLAGGDSEGEVDNAVPLRASRMNNNNLFYIAPQQHLYELLALYRSTDAIKHRSCYLN